MNKTIIGDALTVLKTMDSGIVNTCVTSPPYWGLRDYGVDGQLGLEKTPEEYVGKMVEIFREVRRVLRDDGTLWLNLGDSYCASAPGNKPSWDTSGLHGAKSPKYQDTLNRSVQIVGKKDYPGLKPKDLIGIPWRVAFALQFDGWYLRQDIIWHKPNPMPESVTDRCTKAHEYVFLMSKSAKYYYDAEAIKEDSKYPDDDRKSRSDTTDKRMPTDMIAGVRPGNATYEKRNKRSVWTVTTKPYKEAHFATYPPDLISPMILAGCPEGGIVLDPFLGSGTTAMVALSLRRNYIGIELNESYVNLVNKRITNCQVEMF